MSRKSLWCIAPSPAYVRRGGLALPSNYGSSSSSSQPRTSRCGIQSLYFRTGVTEVLARVAPCTTTMRDLEAPLPAYQGRGRRPKPPWQSVTAWRQALAVDAWTRLTVRDGEKGPVGIEMIKRRVQTRLERKRTGPEEWLVVTRRPLADDSTLEPQASRDATDQDAGYRYHYYLTPTQLSESELVESSLAELARVIKAGL